MRPLYAMLKSKMFYLFGCNGGVRPPPAHSSCSRTPDEPRAWWFEIFDTGRRIILASLVCFTSKPIMQLWLAMGFTVVRETACVAWEIICLFARNVFERAV